MSAVRSRPTPQKLENQSFMINFRLFSFNMMNSLTIFSLLEKNQSILSRYGVEQIGLFGSYVRNEQSDASDIDLLVEFSRGKKSLHNLVSLADDLEKLFGKRVEIVTKESLSPYIGPHILREVQYASVAH